MDPYEEIAEDYARLNPPAANAKVCLLPIALFDEIDYVEGFMGTRSCPAETGSVTRWLRE
jgi:hypothetical protein